MNHNVPHKAVLNGTGVRLEPPMFFARWIRSSLYDRREDKLIKNFTDKRSSLKTRVYRETSMGTSESNQWSCANLVNLLASTTRKCSIAMIGMAQSMDAVLGLSLIHI